MNTPVGKSWVLVSKSSFSTSIVVLSPVSKFYTRFFAHKIFVLNVVVSTIEKSGHVFESEFGPSPRSMAWVELRLHIREVNGFVAMATKLFLAWTNELFNLM